NRVLAGQEPASAFSVFGPVVAKDFGRAATVREAWQANPRALLWHVGTNAVRTPAVMRELVEARLDLAPNAGRVLRAAIVGAALLGIVGMALRLRSRDETGGDKHGPAVALVMMTALLVPSAASALVVFPRQHYLIPAVLFLIALAAAGLGGVPRLRR